MGIVIGYQLTYQMILYKSWEWSYYIQSMACLPCALAIFLAPNKYFDVEDALNYKAMIASKIEQQNHGEIVESMGNEPIVEERHSSVRENYYNFRNQSLLQNEPKLLEQRNRVFSMVINSQESGNHGLLSSEYKLHGFKKYEPEEKMGILEKLKSLKSNIVFIKLAFSLAGLYFIVSGI